MMKKMKEEEKEKFPRNHEIPLRATTNIFKNPTNGYVTNSVILH
jgi:hypothetical protein